MSSSHVFSVHSVIRCHTVGGTSLLHKGHIVMPGMTLASVRRAVLANCSDTLNLVVDLVSRGSATNCSTAVVHRGASVLTPRLSNPSSKKIIEFGNKKIWARFKFIKI